MWFIILTVIAVAIVLMYCFTDFPISPVQAFLFLLAYIYCCKVEIESIIMKRKLKNDEKKDSLKEFEKEIIHLSLDELNKFHQKIADQGPDERIDIVERRIDKLIEEKLKDSPAEELNKQLEQEFKLKKHTKALVAKVFCALLLIVTFLSYFKRMEQYESFRGFCIGGAAILYNFVCIAESRFSFFGDLYHKNAYPAKYWLSICALFILGAFSIIIFGVYGT